MTGRCFMNCASFGLKCGAVLDELHHILVDAESGLGFGR